MIEKQEKNDFCIAFIEKITHFCSYLYILLILFSSLLFEFDVKVNLKPQHLIPLFFNGIFYSNKSPVK
ncbi:hypothetical protein P278_25340 [Zhouia amylolytica AD3]|uniref:Uncharacterized protein n=1 Tax=Zhouia amylolytica AD3 TaxID=1286632 RepID=W2UMA0_9FLAO|nr:hypothetical protein P278_25340 [Zhouia amylolytica AD3]